MSCLKNQAHTQIVPCTVLTLQDALSPEQLLGAGSVRCSSPGRKGLVCCGETRGLAQGTSLCQLLDSLLLTL